MGAESLVHIWRLKRIRSVSSHTFSGTCMGREQKTNNSHGLKFRVLPLSTTGHQLTVIRVQRVTISQTGGLKGNTHKHLCRSCSSVGPSLKQAEQPSLWRLQPWLWVAGAIIRSLDPPLAALFTLLCVCTVVGATEEQWWVSVLVPRPVCCGLVWQHRCLTIPAMTPSSPSSLLPGSPRET